MERSKVLVVDDDLDSLVLATAMLDDAGYRVYSAVDVSQALQLAREHRPQTVLLDHHLPVITGLDALQQLRHEPALLGASIILISSRDFGREELREVDGYVRKPWTPGQLVTTIEKAHGLSLGT